MIDDSWPGQRARYRQLRLKLDSLTTPDRNIDAELGRMFFGLDVSDHDSRPLLADGSEVPRFTAWKLEAEKLWRRNLLDDPIPNGTAIEICRRLVFEAAEIYE